MTSTNSYTTNSGGSLPPWLGPLQNNGGSTEIHTLDRSTTPASVLNAGDNSLIPEDLGDQDGDEDTTEAVPFDQRGSGFDRIVGGTVDVGA